MTESSKPPLTTTTSIKPAMTVLGVAIGTLVIFLVINLIANPKVTTTSSAIPVVVGGLATDPSNIALAGCRQSGNPPSDIAPAMTVPVRTIAVSPVRHRNGGAGDYDCLRTLVTRTSAGSLLGYYQSHLTVRGWNLFSQGSGDGAPQMLFQKAGSDTFYWVIGITVNHQHDSTVQWTFRIYQNSSAI